MDGLENLQQRNYYYHNIMIGDIAEYLGWNQMFKEYISIYTFSAKPKICILGSKSEKRINKIAK